MNRETLRQLDATTLTNVYGGNDFPDRSANRACVTQVCITHDTCAA